jgi:uncharacterized protein YjbJ (UPF0337 family)
MRLGMTVVFNWLYLYARRNERRLIMNITVNRDVLAGKLKQFQGKVRQWWGKLTKNQPTQIRGFLEGFAGLVQERYGYLKCQIEKRCRDPRNT